MKHLRKFIRQALLGRLDEALGDIKPLVKANKGALFDEDPAAFKALPPEEQARRAEKGPRYPSYVIDAVRDIPDHRLPSHNRRAFITWLADAFVAREAPLRGEALNALLDWVGEHPNAYAGMTFLEAMAASDEWHRALFDTLEADDGRTILHRGEDIMHEWPDGWAVVMVPPGDCGAEGEAMGHCVGGYAGNVASGRTHIYSLRDPAGRPHATIEVDGVDSVRQIKGKGNRPPVEKHARRIKEWLETTRFDAMGCDDFFRILDDDDIAQMMAAGALMPFDALPVGTQDRITAGQMKGYVEALKHEGGPDRVALAIKRSQGDAYIEEEAPPDIANQLMLDVLSHDGMPELRTMAAKHGSLDTLTRLASDPDSRVRRATAARASNPNIDLGDAGMRKKLVRGLMDDDDARVAFAAHPISWQLEQMPDSGVMLNLNRQTSFKGRAEYETTPDTVQMPFLMAVARDDFDDPSRGSTARTVEVPDELPVVACIEQNGHTVLALRAPGGKMVRCYHSRTQSGPEITAAIKDSRIPTVTLM